MHPTPEHLMKLALHLEGKAGAIESDVTVANGPQQAKAARFYARVCRWAHERLSKRVDPKTMPTSPDSMRIAAMFRRQLTTVWSPKERKSFRELKSRGVFTTESMDAVELFYRLGANDPEAYLRTSLVTFLNNFDSEVDKAREWLRRHPQTVARKSAPPRVEEPEPAGFRAWLASAYPRADARLPWGEVPADVKSEFKSTL